MTITELLNKAGTKDELEALGIKHLGVNVDKRKSKEVIRAELLNAAEAKGNPEVGDPETKEPAGEQPQPQGQDSSKDASAPESDPQDAPPAPAGEPQSGSDSEASESGKYPGKLGRHRKTGRVMPWTAAMAKNRDIEQMG